MFTLRRALPDDRDALVEICRITEHPADGPRDPDRDPELLGEVYVAPYVVADPDLATVAVDEAGVAGYVVGTDDTRAFEAWLDEAWFPRLRAAHPLGSGAASEQWLIEHLHRPGTAPDQIVAGHPAHLHIDLLARARSQGVGRRLMAEALETLAARGVPGVHLGVVPANDTAIAFYERLGFTAQLRLPDVVWMTRPLP